MSNQLHPVDLKALEGRSIFITGGASGLGRDTVSAFVAAGAYVTIADVQNAEALVKELTASGGHVQFVECDASSWLAQVEAFKQAIAFSPNGVLDDVLLFAGVDRQGHMVDQVNATDASVNDPPAPNLESMAVNLEGSYYSAFLALHHFRNNTTTATKSLTFVSSLAGYIDDTHNSSYTASKFGSRGIFRAIRARAFAELKVRCNLIAPWAIKTPMTAPILAAMEQYGITEGKGMTFAKSETVVESAGRLVVDESLQGRAIAIMPEGAFDIGDDIAGAYAGTELQKLMASRVADGDFIQG